MESAGIRFCLARQPLQFFKQVSDIPQRSRLKFAFAARAGLKQLERSFGGFTLIGNLEYKPLLVEILDCTDVARIRTRLQIPPVA